MDVLDIFRVLLRHRLLLVAGLLVAALIGYAVAQRTSEQRANPTASARLLVGPSNATATTLDTVTPETLMMKAPLLADVLSTDDMRARIAQRAGIRPDQLTVMGPAFGAPTVAVPLATRATEVAAIAGTPFALVVRSSEQIPVITMMAQAPSAAAAAKLIDAAGGTLRDFVEHPVTPVRKKHGARLVVQQLGPIEVRTIMSGHARILAVAAGIVVFGFWCCSIVILAGLARVRRNARARRVALQLDELARA
jgi:hypothetical protein